MRMSRWYLVELLIFSAGIAAAQSSLPVSEIKLHSDPEDTRVRPFESIAIQVRAYGGRDGQKLVYRAARP